MPSKPKRRGKPPKPTLKALTARVAAIERTLRDFASRHLIAADVLHGSVLERIDGIRTVRGNDGVILGTINLREKSDTAAKKIRT